MSINPSDEEQKIFIRLKPTVNENNVVQVLDSRTLLFKMPSKFTRPNLPDQFKYTFSHIYEPDTTQSQIYSGCVAPLVKELFSGQHCLLFTYGTKNAGKTFTVLGTGDNPGLIPHTLTTVFKSISGKENISDLIKPDKFDSTIEVSENTLMGDRKFKEDILTWKSCQDDFKLHKTNCTVPSSEDETFGESVFRKMKKSLTNDTSIIVEFTSKPEERFSVWVSFAEIYNESVFDLLQPVTPDCKRKQLKLGLDNNKNYYVKDLKHVFVQSEEEAYKVLMFGKQNLQVAATEVNSRSSRSHCIFTIKLIKSPNVDHPERMVVSSFSICDLAGAERQKKTLNVEPTLKESKSINYSLLILSRCFTTIRENQHSTEPKMIPFRDSKLTQLFKHALTGKEAVTMIVNVNPEHELCEETLHVLGTTAIAKHVVVQPRKVKTPKTENKRQSMFAQVVKHNQSALIPWDSCVKNKTFEQVLDEIPVNEEIKQNEQKKIQETYENLLSVIEEYKEKLKEERAKHNETKRNWIMKEEEIRREAKEEMIQFLKMEKQQEEQDSKRKEKVDKTNKRRLLTPEEHPAVKKFEDAGLDQSYELNVLQEEVKLQQKQLDGLAELVNILKVEKEELGKELAFTKVNLSHRNREIINLKAKIETFVADIPNFENGKEYLRALEEKLKIREELLNEAKEDMLADQREKDNLAKEISRLEQELTEKEEQLLSQKEDMEQKSSDTKDEIDLLKARIENMELVHEDELKTIIIETEEAIARLKQEKVKCQSLKEVLSKKSEEIDSLQKVVESHTIDKKKLEEEYRSEIKSLEQSYKNQLKEMTELWNENERLTKELSKVKTTVADSNQLLKDKEREVEVLRKKLLEYKGRCEDQKKTIINMKQLEELNEEIKDLRNQSEKKEKLCEKLQEENEKLCFQMATPERIVGGPTSLVSVKEDKQSKPTRMEKLGVDVDIRRRAQSCEEAHYSSYDVDVETPKSAPKARTTIRTITSPETDDSKISGNKPTENKEKQSRKKL